MDVPTSKSLPAFGFLTVVEDPQHGFFGGYLVLSELGRPLEFHCSTPVQPNQAQKILYGATLRSYILGELIGQTLLATAQLPVLAVLADQVEMLSLALLRPETLAYVTPLPAAAEVPCQGPRPAEEKAAPELVLGTWRLQGSSSCSWQPDALAAELAPLIRHVDLAEPFARIRGAIQEAQRISTPPADETYGSAAA